MFKPGLILDRLSATAAAPAAQDMAVPEHLDRRPELLDTSDQGETSLCASHAGAGLVEYWQWKRGPKAQVDPQPIHRAAKLRDGFPDDEATTLLAVIQAIHQLGLLRIDLESVRMIKTLAEVKHALHAEGVVLAAFGATANWNWATKSGWIESGGEFLGPHAVLLCGYSDVEKPQWIALQNSWGQARGWRGFMRMQPKVFAEQFYYAYSLRLA